LPRIGKDLATRQLDEGDYLGMNETVVWDKAVDGFVRGGVSGVGLQKLQTG
jgi:hypothetical protein